MSRYRIKEAFYSLQGEGRNAGRPAVFCRFSGCNLWSGKEAHRATAVCSFCDTDFVGTGGRGGGRFSDADALTEHILKFWPDPSVRPFVVLTGGEPMLQVDESLIASLHRSGAEIAIETNGTLPVPESIDWICVSPKAGTTLRQLRGHELKFVYPQQGLAPDNFVDLAFEHFLIQPKAGSNAEQDLQATLTYCLEHPRWRLTLQTHKYLGIR